MPQPISLGSTPPMPATPKRAAAHNPRPPTALVTLLGKGIGGAPPGPSTFALVAFWYKPFYIRAIRRNSPCVNNIDDPGYTPLNRQKKIAGGCRSTLILPRKSLDAVTRGRRAAAQRRGGERACGRRLSQRTGPWSRARNRHRRGQRASRHRSPTTCGKYPPAEPGRPE